jgi:hypothetical protein
MKSMCEQCGNYEYDEEQDCYVCLIRLDEMEQFLMHAVKRCPYFQLEGEYKTVRKQN